MTPWRGSSRFATALCHPHGSHRLSTRKRIPKGMFRRRPALADAPHFIFSLSQLFLSDNLALSCRILASADSDRDARESLSPNRINSPLSRVHLTAWIGFSVVLFHHVGIPTISIWDRNLDGLLWLTLLHDYYASV